MAPRRFKGFRADLRCAVPALALAAAGCASTLPSPPSAPAAVDAAAVARGIELCRTSLADLQGRLGEPTRDGLLHGARVVSWVIGLEPVVRYLAVLVDGDGRVTDLYWDVPTEIPWTPTDQCRKAADG